MKDRYDRCQRLESNLVERKGYNTARPGSDRVVDLVFQVPIKDYPEWNGKKNSNQEPKDLHRVYSTWCRNPH